MKVFLAETSLDPRYGGPATRTMMLASALTAAGVEVAVWTRDSSAVDTKGWKHGTPAQRWSGDLRKALSSFGRPEIIHDSGVWLPHNHSLARISRSMQVPRVVNPAGSLQPWALRHKAVKKKVGWLVYQRRDILSAQMLVASSEWEAEHLNKLGLSVPVSVIHHGVEHPGPAGSVPQRGSKKVALFLSRLHVVKGLPMLIAAWGRVQPSNWELRIAGPDEGGHRAVVENAVSEAGLTNDVTFLGAVTGAEKSKAYFDADLFILPSYSESFGNVVAEALAHGLPVLTTTGTPWREIVTRGCGWMVRPTVDDLEAGLRLATALDRGALQAMGAKGSEWMQTDFSWEAAARRHLDLYSTVIARSRAR
jgi:glycosyltransferase involved in cell wall biosynthesis